MAPHLTLAELDFLQEKQKTGKTPIEIHSLLVSLRQRKRIEAPHLTKVRKALKGNTYKRSAAETRGRKQVLSRRMVLKMNAVRKTLLKKKPNKEMHWVDVIEATRAPKVHRTTVKKGGEAKGGGRGAKAGANSRKPNRIGHSQRNRHLRHSCVTVASQLRHSCVTVASWFL